MSEPGQTVALDTVYAIDSFCIGDLADAARYA